MKLKKKNIIKERIIREVIARLRGEITTNELMHRGLKVGKNFLRMNQVIIDDSHTWLIEIGNDVTIGPRAHILAHDASTKNYLGYTKIGRVKIGNRVFIGAEAVIMPGVCIGNDVIVGANSTVTHDIPDGVVVAGSPAIYICSTKEYLEKEKQQMKIAHCYGEEYTMRGNISKTLKEKQKKDLSDGKIGYVI